MGLPPFPDFLHASKFDQHLGRDRGIAVAELNELVFPALQPPFPIGRSFAILHTLRLGGNRGEELSMQIKVKNFGLVHGYFGKTSSAVLAI